MKAVRALMVLAGVTSLVALVNCASPVEEGAAPDVLDVDLAEKAVTFGWNQTVATPGIQYSVCSVTGSATFRREASGAATRTGGFCLLESLYPFPLGCNVDADCGQAAPGDYNYCIQSGSLPKACYHKGQTDTGGTACLERQTYNLAVGQSISRYSQMAIGGAGYKYLMMSVLNNPGSTLCGSTAIVPGTNQRYAEHPSYCSRVSGNAITAQEHEGCL